MFGLPITDDNAVMVLFVLYNLWRLRVLEKRMDELHETMQRLIGLIVVRHNPAASPSVVRQSGQAGQESTV